MSKKGFRTAMGVLIVVIAALIGMNMTIKEEKGWDVSYVMANAKVDWMQTHHGGPWN